jgi:SWI/SNF-related matrix-associated actin-dependent regulator 1 of chromatin subfamily A
MESDKKNLISEIKKILESPISIRKKINYSKLITAEVFFDEGILCIRHPFNKNLNKRYQFFGKFKFDSLLKRWELNKLDDIEVAKFILTLNQVEPAYFWKISPEALEKINNIIDAFNSNMEKHRDILSLKKLKTIPIEWDKYLKVEPLDFQKVGIIFIERNNGLAFVGDDMGLGKTMQAIGYTTIHQLKTIVVCPASLKYNWKREIEKFTTRSSCVLSEFKPDVKVIDADYIIINFEQLKKYEKFLEKQKFDCVVIDESQYIKESSSDRYKKCKKLFKKVPKRILLSGTPLKNRPIEFYTQLNFIRPDLFKNKEQYGLRYCDAKENFFGRGYDYSGASNLRELNSKIAHFYIRRIKENVLKDLPEKTINQLDLELTQQQVRDYKYLCQDFKKEYKSNINLDQSLKTIVKIKQYLSKSKISDVVDFVNQSLMQSDRKVIVFSQFKETQNLLLKEFGDKANSIFSEYSSEKRMKEVDEFNTNPDKKVMVSSTIAGGVGFNMTAADMVCFVDLLWNPSDHAQAEDRAYRLGQKKAVSVYYFTYLKTLEPMLMNLLQKKKKIILQALDGKTEEELESDIEIKREFLNEFVKSFDK